MGGLPQHPSGWGVGAARLHLAGGDGGAAALALLDEAVARFNTDMSPPVRPATSVRARARLATGDLAAARRWARDSGLSADANLTSVREHAHLTLGRVLVAGVPAGDEATNDVLPFLGRLLAAAEAGGRPGSVVEILVLTALAHEARGRRVEAVAALDRALIGAGPEHLVGVAAGERPAITPLLRAVAAGPGPGSGLARELLADSPAPAPSTPAAGRSRGHQALVDPLSSRELDVLRLLRGDLSGPEIARELVVSLNTVRTHTRNIYIKLGVRNRREAVRRAAELGL